MWSERPLRTENQHTVAESKSRAINDDSSEEDLWQTQWGDADMNDPAGLRFAVASLVKSLIIVHFSYSLSE